MRDVRGLVSHREEPLIGYAEQEFGVKIGGDLCTEFAIAEFSTANVFWRKDETAYWCSPISDDFIHRVLDRIEGLGPYGYRGVIFCLPAKFDATWMPRLLQLSSRVVVMAVHFKVLAMVYPGPAQDPNLGPLELELEFASVDEIKESIK